MKELRDEKCTCSTEAVRLTAFSASNSATKPINAVNLTNTGANAFETLAGFSKVVDLAPRYLLRDIKIIKKD